MKHKNPSALVFALRDFIAEQDKVFDCPHWRSECAVVIGPWMLDAMAEYLSGVPFNNPKWVVRRSLAEGKTVLDGCVIRYDENERTYRIDRREELA